MRDIEYIKNSHLLLKELKCQNQNFNIIRFYLEKNVTNTNYRGAIQIVTPSHKLSFFANKSHKLAVQNVLRLIYSDFSFFKTELWQEEVCKRGNVLFQLCANSFSLAWIPKQITDYQLEHVVSVCNIINDLNFKALNNKLELSGSFNKHKIGDNERLITVETNLQGNDGVMLSLDEAMPKIKHKVLTYKK